MSNLIAIEQAAQRLELRLLSEARPEIRILHGLAFLRQLCEVHAATLEKVYLLQFAPRLVEAASQADIGRFLPDDVRDSGELASWVAQNGVVPELTHALQGLSERVAAELDRAIPDLDDLPETDGRVCALTVEYYIDLAIPPRGQLVAIKADVTPLPRGMTSDDIHIVNRLVADDRCLRQAQDAVTAARAVVCQHLKIDSQHRHRYDFQFEEAVSHLAGDSLGLALGAVAMCVLTSTEPVRTQWTLQSGVAFAATLRSDGQVGPVDAVMLGHKIVRAFYSPIRYLVVARCQLQEALAAVAVLEARKPGRRLEIVGVEQLSELPSDHRLIDVHRAPLVTHVGHRLVAAKGRYPVAIFIVLMLLATAWWLMLERYTALSFAFRPDGVHAYDRLGFQAWYHPEPAGLDTVQYGLTGNYANRLYQDLDGDGREEMAFMAISPDRSHLGRLVILNRRGKAILDTVVFDKTAIDSMPGTGRFLHYFLTGIIPGTENDPILVLCTRADSPAREYWVFEKPSGEVVGRYHSRGYGSRPHFFDIDNDGEMEMVVSVIHNGWARASVYAIKPVGAEGFSPPGPLDNIWPTLPPGNQLIYYILPHTDLVGFNKLSYPEPWQITKNEDGIHVKTCERPRDAPEFLCHAELNWVFASDLSRFVSLTISDSYFSERQQIVKEGRLPYVDREALRDSLERAVIKWTGSTWAPAK